MARKAEAVLYLLVEQEGKFRHVPIKRASNGRFVPQVTGSYIPRSYYLRYTFEGKRKWESVGPDLNHARSEMIARQQMLDNGKREEKPVEKRKSLGAAISFYLANELAVRGAKSESRTRQLLELFNWKVKKDYIEEIDHETIMDFVRYLIAEGCSPKTVKDRVSSIKTFLRRQGNVIAMEKHDLPKVTKRINDCYTEAEVFALLEASDEDEQFLINFLLATGMREQEAAHTTWADLKGSFVRVTAKPHCRCPHCKDSLNGFNIKDSEEREIPIDDHFQGIFEARRKTHGHQALLFMNGNGNPEGHFLYTLKAIGKRAGIKCAYCKPDGSCKRHSVTTHKLRRTFATWHHVLGGLAVETIRGWLGHSDIETTMRYICSTEIRPGLNRDRMKQTWTGFNLPKPPVKLFLVS